MDILKRMVLTLEVEVDERLGVRHLRTARNYGLVCCGVRVNVLQAQANLVAKVAKKRRKKAARK